MRDVDALQEADQFSSFVKEYLSSEAIDVTLSRRGRVFKKWCASLVVGPVYVGYVESYSKKKLYKQIINMTASYDAALAAL